jgi:hypothetical protein
MLCDEKDRLLEEYVTAREFCDAVEHLRKCSNEVEAFIHAVTRPDEFTAGAHGRGSK